MIFWTKNEDLEQYCSVRKIESIGRKVAEQAKKGKGRLTHY